MTVYLSRLNDLRRREGAADRGIAMLVVVLAVVVVATIGTAAVAVAVRSSLSSGRVTMSGQVTDLANAGLSQGVAYLKVNGTNALSGPWSKDTAINVAHGSGSYSFWIEEVVPWPAPAGSEAVYRIHSTGTRGEARREVVADVGLKPYESLPFGILGTSVTMGGSMQLHDISVFSTGCIGGRSPGSITGTDLLRGIPAAAHSSNYVSQGAHQPNAATTCTQEQSIHNGATGPKDPFSPMPCNTDYPYDHDNAGGDVSATSCNGLPVENTSYIEDKADLLRMFGLSTSLTLEQQEMLKAIAIAQGNYFTIRNPTSSQYGFASDPAHSVYFYDLSGGKVDIKDFDTSRWVDSVACEDESLVIVIRGGSAWFNGTKTLRANIFLIPQGGGETGAGGDWDKGTGTSELIGSLMGDNIDLRGNNTISLDECAVRHTPPSLLDTRLDNYAELDR